MFSGMQSKGLQIYLALQSQVNLRFTLESDLPYN